MGIIDKPGKYASYKAYKLNEDEQHFLNFEKGMDVLPAKYHGDGLNNSKFFFLRKHEALTYQDAFNAVVIKKLAELKNLKHD